MKRLQGPYTHERYLEILDGLKLELMKELNDRDISFRIASDNPEVVEFLLTDAVGSPDWVVVRVLEQITGEQSRGLAGTATVKVWRRFGRAIVFTETNGRYDVGTYVDRAQELLEN